MSKMPDRLQISVVLPTKQFLENNKTSRLNMMQSGLFFALFCFRLAELLLRLLVSLNNGKRASRLSDERHKKQVICMVREEING
jgi:hypothetical protein